MHAHRRYGRMHYRTHAHTDARANMRLRTCAHKGAHAQLRTTVTAHARANNNPLTQVSAHAGALTQTPARSRAQQPRTLAHTTTAARSQARALTLSLFFPYHLIVSPPLLSAFHLFSLMIILSSAFLIFFSREFTFFLSCYYCLIKERFIRLLFCFPFPLYLLSFFRLSGFYIICSCLQA